MYDILIGSMINPDEGTPKIVITISQDQLDIIEMFADMKKDKDLNTIYKLNDVEFRVRHKLELPFPIKDMVYHNPNAPNTAYGNILSDTDQQTKTKKNELEK